MLYIDDDEEGVNNLDSDDQAQSENSEEESEKTLHIRTYKFKTPQFIVSISH